MEKTKHTPGPWSIGAHDKNGQLQVLGAEGDLVCVATHECVGDKEIEMGHNARLISAAPEMLEALKLARYAIDALASTQKEIGLGLLGKQMAPDTLKMIDDVLLKATSTV